MTPEEEARVNIDKLLKQSGWVIQDYKKINLSPTVGLGIAVREFPTLKGPADYMLFNEASPTQGYGVSSS